MWTSWWISGYCRSLGSFRTKSFSYPQSPKRICDPRYKQFQCVDIDFVEATQFPVRQECVRARPYMYAYMQLTKVNVYSVHVHEYHWLIQHEGVQYPSNVLPLALVHVQVSLSMCRTCTCTLTRPTCYCANLQDVRDLLSYRFFDSRFVFVQRVICRMRLLTVEI